MTGNVDSVQPQNYGSLKRVYSCASTVDGNVSVQNASGIGSIQLGGSGCAGGNTVGGNVYFYNNTVTAGEARNVISGNHIGGSVVCYNNNPPPSGTGNVVGGAKVGRCAALG